MTLGSGESGNLTFLDIISILSFFVGLQNLDANLTQDDKQDLQRDLENKTNLVVEDIHSHLTQQDDVLHQILKRLEDLENDHRRDLQQAGEQNDSRYDVSRADGE